MKMDKIDIKSLTLLALQQEIERLGEKKFRARQIYDWLHVKLVDSFDEMTNLSRPLRDALASVFEIVHLKIADCQTSKLDGTRKYLFELSDQNVIESVWMQYKHGNSVCISSQAGCRMGCAFCASTINGLARNLRASEMLDQIYQIQKHTKERVSNVVVMGSGEPFDNYDELMLFLRLLTNEDGLNVSQRNVTVSTCGIVPNIKRFADEGMNVTLALSLHASNQERRRQLMPIANRYSLAETLHACDYFYQQTGRRVTFEYSLAKGVNDQDADAAALVQLLKGKNCHLNLIPINPVRERAFVEPNQKIINDFKHKLESAGINVTVRREMGRDIDGACGQLRKKYMEQNHNE